MGARIRSLIKIFAAATLAGWPFAASAQRNSAIDAGRAVRAAAPDAGVPSAESPLSEQLEAAARGQAAPASAAADGGTPSTEPSLSEQLDAAAGKPVPSAGVPAAASPQIASRGSFQSLNPDIAVIATGAAGFSQRAPLLLAGDDPDLKGSLTEHSAGITLQELELAFQSIVDPYFRADVFLTIPNLNGLEVEEAFLTTTSLPALQVKAGVFRSAFGRQNGMHLHVQDFVERPLINAAYLGTDGLRPPGAQLSWLLPFPFFLQLMGEVFSITAPDVPPPGSYPHLPSFGGGQRTDLTYAGELKLFLPPSESVSIFGGLNVATGVSPGLVQGDATIHQGARTILYGVDLYVKYKPPNQAVTYFSLAWTTEYFLRRIGSTATEDGLTDGGLYTQLVMQIARRWFVGLRQDLLGVPSSDLQPLTSRTTLDLTFYPSEFSKLRGSVQYDAVDSQAAIIQQLALPHVNNFAAYIQFEVAIGAHGAHKF